MATNNITLTKSQANALDMMMDFVDSPSDRVFILKGYAGTGKTTLMRSFIDKLDKKGEQYQLLASTGRAAKVLTDRADDETQAITIHSMIYSFVGFNKDFSDKEEVKVDGNGQLLLVFEPSKVMSDDVSKMIYIIDESSMISDIESKNATQANFGSGRLLRDLLDYDQRKGSKFVFVGDPCQLPPIESYFSPALMPEYFRNTFNIIAKEGQLTEIMRQSGDNDIVVASKGIRTQQRNAPDDKSHYGMQRVWGMLNFKRYHNIHLVGADDELINLYVEKIKRDGVESAICISRSNKMCFELSTSVRRMLGYNSPLPQKGDLLMVVQNNVCGLMNGDMVTVVGVTDKTEQRAGLTFRMIKVRNLHDGVEHTEFMIEDIILNNCSNLNSVQQQSLFVDFIIRMKKKGITQKSAVFNMIMRNDPYLNALRCTYGYAVTCHKAQGGEWNDVFVFIPRNFTLNPTKETFQWIYTAMTRAKYNLYMKNDFYMK